VAKNFHEMEAFLFCCFSCEGLSGALFYLVALRPERRDATR